MNDSFRSGGTARTRAATGPPDGDRTTRRSAGRVT
jgi:hypothetical protein